MELLTGKAKEDFRKYIGFVHGLDLNDWEVQKNVFLNALIVEWLDSVGIKILPCYGLSGWYCELKNYNIKEFGNYKCFLVVKGSVNDFDTRQEATIEAIKKANEIFNQHLNK